MTRAQLLAGAWHSMQPRAEIFKYPIREMQAREWIKKTDDTGELEAELCRFFGVPSVSAINAAPFSQGAGQRAAAGDD